MNRSVTIGVGVAKPLPPGRSEKYMIWRAIERLDPMLIFGSPWEDLILPQQMALLAYSGIRDRETTPNQTG